MPDGTQDPLTKVHISFAEPDLGVGGETLWAKEVGENLYEIQSSPWHTTNVNWLDVVRTESFTPHAIPEFIEVYRRGGHSTIHLYFLDSATGTKQAILKRVNALGATWEQATSQLYAVDVPPEVNLDAVADYLGQQKDADVLDLRYGPQPPPPGSEVL